jgi:hypothetical protein
LGSASNRWKDGYFSGEIIADGATTPAGSLTLGRGSNNGASNGTIVLGYNNGVGSYRNMKIGVSPTTFGLAMGDFGNTDGSGTWKEAFRMAYNSPAQSLEIDSAGDIKTMNVFPKTNNTYDLGSSTHGWKTLYMATDADIIFDEGTTSSSSGVYWNDPNHGIFCDRNSNLIYWKEYGTHYWQTSGSTTRMSLSSSGLWMAGSAYSGRGNGTINAQAVYDDGSLLSCYVFEDVVDGAIDLEKWDNQIPDLDYEETYWDEEDEKEHKSEKMKKRRVQKQRIHKPLRKFMARKGTEYDPMDIDRYAKHWKEKKHLTSMPNKQKFDPKVGLSTGAYIQRLVETVEIQAVHIENLNQRLKKLNKRLKNLEKKGKI